MLELDRDRKLYIEGVLSRYRYGDRSAHSCQGRVYTRVGPNLTLAEVYPVSRPEPHSECPVCINSMYHSAKKDKYFIEYTGPIFTMSRTVGSRPKYVDLAGPVRKPKAGKADEAIEAEAGTSEPGTVPALEAASNPPVAAPAVSLLSSAVVSDSTVTAMDAQPESGASADVPVSGDSAKIADSAVAQPAPKSNWLVIPPLDTGVSAQPPVAMETETVVSPPAASLQPPTPSGRVTRLRSPAAAASTAGSSAVTPTALSQESPRPAKLKSPVGDGSGSAKRSTRASVSSSPASAAAPGVDPTVSAALSSPRTPSGRGGDRCGRRYR